jgi:valyl-tRNA synthetase
MCLLVRSKERFCAIIVCTDELRIKAMNDKFLKPYSPQDTESAIYKRWEESGFFNPDACIKKGVTSPDAEPFSIVLPPPNVTGTLHMGHASMLAIEDIMVRYNRMKGRRTLWIPGTDHAAIATQSKVEKNLQKEGVRKSDLGREEFLKRVETFAQESHDTIVGQVKRMGSSVDWSREAFTLDKPRERAVRTAFKRMYDDGLIYRGYRVVNWDPKGQTTISDDEVVHEERTAKFYTFKYSKDFPITIATTRPETKLGDTAVAVHPDDARYKEFIGKTFDVDFVGVKLSIKIVGDISVDPEFGTGALGVTPAHSAIDWEIAQRHDLPLIPVIDEYAKISLESPFKGMKAAEAREAIVEKLKSEGLLEKEEDIKQNISTAERTGGIIEPLPKLQWFINVNKTFKIADSKISRIASSSEATLKELMQKSVQTGQIKIIPERFERVYSHWIENLRDWCISRQIWYGHRIPVWYRGTEIFCGVQAPEGDGWEQDPDTLDTWFSSGLWTFSTLGWPDLTEDFKTYHPTSILETGYDILFFWVARMILMSTYLLGDIPFKTVYLHGLVRDAKGRKMSKSLGNIIDPVDMIEKYGADATRMSLIIGTGPGNDSKLSEDKIKAYKNFANKIWNATRFVLQNTEDFDADAKLVDIEALSPESFGIQHAYLAEFEATLADITSDIENYRFYLAGEKLYHYFWHTFADIIIEESKKFLAESAEDKKMRWIAQYTLRKILTDSLKALHPFMPFITEEIWSMLPQAHGTLLMVEKWPHTSQE